MADIAKPDADVEAEKAYADAAAKAPVAPKPEVTKAAPVEAAVPAPAKAPAQIKAPAAKPAAPVQPAAPEPVAAPVAAKAPVAKVVATPKQAPAKPVPVKKTPAKPVAAQPAKTKSVPIPPKPVAAQPAKPKETRTMATTTTDITAKIQDAVKDAAAKAKTFAEKSQAGFGEATEFAKGNAEAVVESTKILASGLQEMGKAYVAEAKTAFETMTADAKELAAAKTPAEFFEKQTAILKKNFDAAVAKSSKSSEAVLKLANEALQPLSTRVSLAIEKVKKAA